jgi:hypothetical protein
VTAVVLRKLADAADSTFEPEFTPEEADFAGAFLEDALSESDAREAGPILVRSGLPAVLVNS